MIHTPEQLEQKRQAIQEAAFALFLMYSEGLFENDKNEALLHHTIESIHELIREYNHEKTD